MFNVFLQAGYWLHPQNGVLSWFLNLRSMVTAQFGQTGDNFFMSKGGGELVLADGAEERGGCADDREDEAEARGLGGCSWSGAGARS